MTVRELSFEERRASLALMEAIIPGSEKVPGADEITLRRTEELVEAFHPMLVGAWRTAQRTLSAAAFFSKGQPFHALSFAAQQEMLVSWRSNGVLRSALGLVSLLYKLVHFDRPQVYEKLGGHLNVVQSIEQPSWLSQVQHASEWQEGEVVDCDVVVVGTGAGGAIVGHELAERGYAVVFVEEGKHYRRDDFDGSSVRAHQRFYRGAFSVGNAVMPVYMGRLVGGSTAVNGGTCFRTPSWVLDRFCDEMRSDEFSPSNMERFFTRVESALDIAPTDERYLGPMSDVIGRGAKKLGWSHSRIARNAPGCQGSGFCDFGCRIDGRNSMDISFVPRALRKGAVLFTEFRAEQVRVESGRATGLVGRAPDGREIRINARAVVLSGGAIPTPMLLLRQGICDESGQVGRNLTLHPSTGIAGLFEDRISGADYVPQGHVVDEFARENILLLTALADRNIAPATFTMVGTELTKAVEQMEHVGGLGTLVADDARGRVRAEKAGFPVITYNVTKLDVKRLHESMVRGGELLLAAGAKRLYPAMFSMPIVERDNFHTLRNHEPTSSDFALVSYHPLGTCKMGRDPKKSVVDLNHETHSVKKLFVVDGSTVPGPLGVNPQLTIMAMAMRASERIAAVLG